MLPSWFSCVGVRPHRSAGDILRKAENKDLDVIVANNIAMAQETEGLDLSPETVKTGVKTVLDAPHNAKGCYIVSECEGQVVGQLMVTHEYSDWHAADYWWIQSVYVQPEYRRQGRFRRLYNFTRRCANAENAAGLRLYADANNTTAQAVYRSLGMTNHYLVFEDPAVPRRPAAVNPPGQAGPLLRGPVGP